MIRDCLPPLRVVDFTQIGAGPTCTMLLADMGADVIKVEPLNGDLGRDLGPPWYDEASPVFIAFNRGKRSIALDLKSEEGLAATVELVKSADVVVESFRPGVLARFGLDYAAARQSNPDVIYCSLSGYGQTGPYARKAGVDGILQADSGLMSLIGLPGAEPCKVQAPVVDVFSGYVAALGVLARLLSRERTGQGGQVDVSLFASAIALQQSAITSYLGNGELPEPLGSAAPYSAPNEAFQTSDGWIMIAAYIGERWPKLCRLVGCAELAEDARFATSSLRIENRPAMRAALAPFLARRTTDEWLALLQEHDILCGPVADYARVMQHPQLAHLGMITGLGADEQAFRTVGSPIDAAASNARPFRPAPTLGEHSAAVLAELGWSRERIRAAMASGAVLHSRDYRGRGK